MSAETVTIIREIPDSQIPDGIGQGTAPPEVIDITTPNTYTVSDFGVPADQDVTVELWGAGGGGGGGGTDTANGGAASGAGYVCVLVPAALWALDGVVNVGGGGTGGLAESPGQDGHNTFLTLNSIVRATAALGIGGCGTDGDDAEGGSFSIGAGVTLIGGDKGGIGLKGGPAGQPKPGGKGGGPGGGAGGAAGTGVSGTGGTGQQAGGGGGGGNGPAGTGGVGGHGRARLTFSIT